MERIKYLDTLRGVAILLVVFSHIYSGDRYMIYKERY